MQRQVCTQQTLSTNCNKVVFDCRDCSLCARTPTRYYKLFFQLSERNFQLYNCVTFSGGSNQTITFRCLLVQDRGPHSLFIWPEIYSARGPQPHDNAQHSKWTIAPPLMLLSSSPSRAWSLMLSLLALPALTSAIVSPIWLYFQQRHDGLNLN